MDAVKNVGPHTRDLGEHAKLSYELRQRGKEVLGFAVLLLFKDGACGKLQSGLTRHTGERIGM